MKAFCTKSIAYLAENHSYATFRIPALEIAPDNTILTFAEARKESKSDWTPSALVCRRSFDKGQTWAPIQVLHDSDQYCVNNPLVITDPNRNTIHLLHCVNYERAFYRKSTNNGQTFSNPIEITKVFETFKKIYPWVVIAIGPGHGLQTREGRLIAPIWMSTRKAHVPNVAATIYSDDFGETWQPGDLVPQKWKIMNESMVEELENGEILMHIRTQTRNQRRAYALSKTGHSGWTEPQFHDQLIDPTCQASLKRISWESESGKSRLLFSNPANLSPNKWFWKFNTWKHRRNGTIRLSYDEGRSWPVAKVIEPNGFGYSDLAVDIEKNLYCIYEGNSEAAKTCKYANLTLARFNLEWLTDGADCFEE